jgi:hypothetical protein
MIKPYLLPGLYRLGRRIFPCLDFLGRGWRATEVRSFWGTLSPVDIRLVREFRNDRMRAILLRCVIVLIL